VTFFLQDPIDHVLEFTTPARLRPSSAAVTGPTWKITICAEQVY